MERNGGAVAVAAAHTEESVAAGLRDPKPEGGAGDGAPTAGPLQRVRGIVVHSGLLILLIVLVGVLSAVSPAFRDSANLALVLQQNSVIGIVACGMLLMIISGGFDLSVGAVGAMSGMVAATLIVHTNSVPLGLFGAAVAGAIFGLGNGILIAKIKINPFVATLGTQTVLTGVLYVVSKGQPVYGLPASFINIGLGDTAGIPNATLIWCAVILLTAIALRLSRFGHYVFSVGGNEEASRLAGVPVDRVKLTVYAVGGLFAAVAGIVLLSQSNVAQPGAATTWPLQAIAICVVGGAALSGGTGRIVNTVVATLLLGAVANALNIFNVSPYLQPVVSGAVILVAVAADAHNRRKRAA
jgi:ribose/xylose/arabinose/galactoside ABC-type transport system permease subunit